MRPKLRLPEVNGSSPLDQETGHLPTPVANGVIEGCPASE